MFEYMSAGLATIASKFPIYKDFIDGNNCGICVNPLNPKEIAEAIEYITTHPKEAEKMGINGKKAVIEKYNWDMEEKKLFQVYKELMSYE
jgi:glycosyltransferase involved in cell wall biosynthesis